MVCLVGAGRGLVAVVLVDDDGVGDVPHHDVLEPQVPREARASLKEIARVGAGGCGGSLLLSQRQVFYLPALDTDAVGRVGEQAGVDLHVLHHVGGPVLSKASDADAHVVSPCVRDQILEWRSRRAGSHLMPWPGPHEMSFTRTSEQLPTMETQSSPARKREETALVKY
jgi:hypothetical protein